MRPPRVVTVAFVKDPEGVNEARVQEVLKALTLFARVAPLANVGFGVREVVRRVRDVQVAAENDGLGFFELFDVMQEGGIPLRVSKGDPLEFVLRVGCVDRHEKEAVKLSGQNAPFSVGIAVGVGSQSELVN